MRTCAGVVTVAKFRSLCATVPPSRSAQKLRESCGIGTIEGDRGESWCPGDAHALIVAQIANFSSARGVLKIPADASRLVGYGTHGQ